jgi:DDB1- and CUL4-associated factor 8
MLLKAVDDLRRGLISPIQLRQQSNRNESLIQRLELQHSLQGHGGCVNTCSFSPDGQVLLSGSDDLNVIFHDWAAPRRLLQYYSGHRANVFQAKAMPFSGNRTVVTCAADGQVRVGFLGEGGGTPHIQMLARHAGRAHKLAIEPGSSTVFMSCGEDGVVNLFDLRQPRPSNKELLLCKTTQVCFLASSIFENPVIGVNVLGHAECTLSLSYYYLVINYYFSLCRGIAWS